jgi:hypothetical protein
MALPSSGPLSIGNIRTELGMPSTSNFSLLNAFNSATGYPILNPFSPVNPNSNPIKSIGAWRGYSSATINWTNNGALGGVSNLQIYVNGILVLNNTNPSSAGTSGTLVVNNGNTFYATMTPITYSGFFGTTAYINTFRLLSPFNGQLGPPFTLLNQTTSSTPYATFSSPTQTVSIVPTDLGVYEIDAFC